MQDIKTQKNYKYFNALIIKYFVAPIHTNMKRYTVYTSVHNSEYFSVLYNRTEGMNGTEWFTVVVVIPSNNSQTVHKNSEILIYLELGEVFTVDLSEEQHQQKLAHNFIKKTIVGSSLVCVF
jgi:hypothetical protein